MPNNYKNLIPNLLSYTSTIGLNYLTDKFLDKKKYKKKIKAIKTILETAPNFGDTIFSAAKKGNDLVEKVFLIKYQNVSEFIEDFLLEMKILK